MVVILNKLQQNDRVFKVDLKNGSMTKDWNGANRNLLESHYSQMHDAISALWLLLVLKWIKVEPWWGPLPQACDIFPGHLL